MPGTTSAANLPPRLNSRAIPSRWIRTLVLAAGTLALASCTPGAPTVDSAAQSDSAGAAASTRASGSAPQTRGSDRGLRLLARVVTASGQDVGKGREGGMTHRSERTTSDLGGFLNRDNGWYRGDLHFHTNYSGDALDQHGDWVGPALRIAEYYQDPVFQAAFPQYIDNQFDYVALTDHRTTDGIWDQDFQSDKLILIPGEEFGNSGHAGALNITRTETSDAQDGRTESQQIQFATDDTVAQGGVFSPNHPVGDDDMWYWDNTGYGSSEVWNTYWTFLGPPTPESVLDDNVAGHNGEENRYIRRAVRQAGQGLSGQYLAWYEAHLIDAWPLAAVGGGDRHMLVMPGHPTTYIQSDDPSPEGLIDGIRRRHTFVSRSPVGPQVLLTATVGGQTWRMGDVIPAGQPVSLTVHVTRANAGRLRLRTGAVHRNVTRDQLLAMPDLGSLLIDLPIPSADYTWTGTWAPAGEAWIYAQVLESADYSDQPADVQKDLDALRRAMVSYGENYGELALALLPLMDKKSLLLPQRCDPALWDVNRTICVDIDDYFLGTMHESEAVDRLLNLYRENDKLTEYAMGAISSPILALSQPAKIDGRMP